MAATNKQESGGSDGGPAFDPTRAGLDIIIAQLCGSRMASPRVHAMRILRMKEVQPQRCTVRYARGRDLAARKATAVTVAEIRDAFSKSISEEPLFHTVDYVTVADVRQWSPFLTIMPLVVVTENVVSVTLCSLRRRQTSAAQG